MIMNHNCCIKLVPLVIFIYDARSHINKHQTKPTSRNLYSYQETEVFHLKKWSTANSLLRRQWIKLCVWDTGGVTLTGELKCLIKHLCQCQFAHHKCHMSWPVLERGTPW